MDWGGGSVSVEGCAGGGGVDSGGGTLEGTLEGVRWGSALGMAVPLGGGSLADRHHRTATTQSLSNQIHPISNSVAVLLNKYAG